MEEAVNTEAHDKLLDLARYQHSVLADILELADPRSTTPPQAAAEIRVKAKAALNEAKRLGLMP